MTAPSRTAVLDSMPEQRRALLTVLKTRGPLSTTELAEHLGVTYEAVRQQLGQLEIDGWVTKQLERDSPGPGRPRSLVRLTSAGDHLFPKEYEELAVALLDAAGERLGPAAVRTLLEEVTRRKVEEWESALQGQPIEKRLEALTGIYQQGDPYCHVELGDGGEPRLVEMNCPFLEVARRRPALCSVTVSALRRLLGREVVRVERFQQGHGRCVFQVLPDRPVTPEAPEFDWEPPAGGEDGDDGANGGDA